MASVSAELEKLKWLVSKGHGDEKIHITFVERDQKERIKNNRRVTRFSLETKNPDVCSELHAEWERVIKRVGNKTLALDLWVRSLKEALSDGEIDRIMAAMEGPE
jgi:hypothetical protein